jgi:hypothetical protein
LTLTLGPGCTPVGSDVLVFIESDNTSVLDPTVATGFSSNTPKTITLTAGTPASATTVMLRALRGTATSDWIPVTVLAGK